MKKALLLCAAALFSLIASAGDGLVAVGANTILLPSSRWDGDIEWKAMTWVFNTGEGYGEWNEQNPNYNLVCGRFYPDDDDYIDAGPSMDANGLRWFELGYDLGEKEDDWNTVTDEPIYWEEHTAPYSSDENYNGRPSYQWTGNSIVADIFVRRTFVIPEGMLLAGPVYLACGHDDAPCEYYINGVLVFSKTGYEEERYDEDGNVHYANGWNNDEYFLLTDDQKALINLNGEENVIAFHVHQNWGGALADCGLYTQVEGGIDMGYVTPWEGKVLFNNQGGFLRSENNQPVESTVHPWSKLYQALEGDEYTFTLEGSSSENTDDFEWKEVLKFKTPIPIQEDHDYSFKARIKTDKPFSYFSVMLTDNDDEGNFVIYDDGLPIEAPIEGNEEDYEGTLLEYEFGGVPDLNNFMIAFDFGGGQDSTTVTISEISLRDITEGNEEDAIELWVGTHYFNYFDMHKTVTKYMIYDDTIEDWREAKTEEEKEYADIEESLESVNAPEVLGRTETLAWTLPDFDDSMWDDQMMPVGNMNYNPRPASNWPGNGENYYYEGDGGEGNNTNYWIRRNFELDKINTQLSYELNVCHDDTYWTYVNGHLLQQNGGWTNGKTPVQVHIPAKYLNVGKNVIATYIQQNWGGRFYDCGINVTEINYQECLQLFNDALDYAKTDTLLTNTMWDEVHAIVAKARAFYNENKNDAAELRTYARDSLMPSLNAIFAYSSSVKALKDTWDICRKMEDKGFWSTYLEDAVAALDTCATPGQITPYINNLREARKATAMERHTENYVGCVPTSVNTEDVDGDINSALPKYYIYNVGAKNFLGGGEQFGTHTAIEYASNPMMLINAVRTIYDEDGEWLDEEVIPGAYFIETFRPNGDPGSMDFLGWNGFVDIPMNDAWELIPVEGKPNVYNIAQYGVTYPTDTTYTETDEMVVTGGERKLLGLRNGDNAWGYSYYVVDTDNKTPELETNQWMFISREEMINLLATASETNPIDATFLINAPGYDERFHYGDYWVSENCGRLDLVFEAYDKKGFFTYQIIQPKEGETALPGGTYRLMVQGYYRDGIERTHLEKYLASEPVEQRANLFAGPTFPDGNYVNKIPLAPIHVGANQVPGIGYTYKGLTVPGTYGGQPRSATAQAGEDYFPSGLYWNNIVFTIDDTYNVPRQAGSTELVRTLVIGIEKPTDQETPSGDWAVFDNWRLVYYGNDVDPDGIKGVESDEIKKETIAKKGIYNMLGQRLQKAQKGVNIINGKKVILK